MIDVLEELAKHRDYRLDYVFTNCWCGLPTKILLHRFEEEVQVNRKNIKQWCGIHDFKHVTRPHKKCSKCGNLYEIEADTCITCEPKVREITELEVGILNARAMLLRIGRQLKRKKITDAQYTKRSQELEEEIQTNTRKLKNMS